MSELLIELFSEEIPARMQEKAAEDLQRLITDGLKQAGLEIKAAQNFTTPRRLTLVIEGLADKSPDVTEEKKGPRVGAPEKAIEGFLKGAGLKSLEEAEVIKDPKKGDYYIAVIEKPGRATTDVLAELVPDVIRKFPWPKSMRWGAGKLRWVRPLHSILCLFGGKVVSFDVEGIKSGNTTRGHRFMAPAEITVKSFVDYREKLKNAKVILESADRRDEILKQAKKVASDNKLELIEDAGLLSEAAGLVEWPTVLMGGFDEAFLDVPPEVLSTSMKAHQKCFSLKAKDGKLANKFLLVSNLIPEDGGSKIIGGNERVIRARLSDAKFFWDNDKERPLEDLLPKLGLVIFHERLGTQNTRVYYILHIARKLAPIVGADEQKSDQAANLCKTDLMSEIVFEFPELQGLAGRYIALRQGKDKAVANACAEHYKPQGQNDSVPTEPLSIAIGLADKLNTLVGFWWIDEKPTGSKDPYALRRAALGVIRILLENNIRLSLAEIIDEALDLYQEEATSYRSATQWRELLQASIKFPDSVFPENFSNKSLNLSQNQKNGIKILLDLLSFFADRLKVYLRDKGARHDLIDAVFSLGGQDDLLMIVKRVEALGAFLETDDGKNLLAGVKRGANILRIEEKKDSTTYDGSVKENLLTEVAEKNLYKAVVENAKAAEKAVGKEDFEGAMAAMAKLRAPVDAFFDKVMVNADDKAVRANRLNLLAMIRNATLRVADFSKIEG